MNLKITLIIFSFITQLAYSQKNNEYKIIAYYTGNAETIKQFPVNKLTHVIYSFLKLENDTLAFRDSTQMKTVQSLVELKNENPNLKIMVAIGGWSGCAPCSDLFSVDEQRKTFAKTAVALFKKYNIDGLDLDWEYPAIEGFPGHKYSAHDKNNFTELVKALRQEMEYNYLLSFAAGGFQKYLEESIDWKNVIPQVDFVNIMSYDLVGGYSTVTGHHTPLFDYKANQESTAKAVNWLLNKNINSKKIIIGSAFYARVWENVSNNNNGLFQNGNFKRGVAFNEFEQYFSDTSGYQYYWDKKSKAPYQYNDSKKLFATFDNEHSVFEKSKFIRKKKLGGIMFWELSQDKKHNGLIDVMSKTLYKK